MGWRGTLRSINAASKRADREAQVRSNEAARTHSKIEKNVQQVLKRAASFAKKLLSDPIKALGLSYSIEEGFTSVPFELSTEVFDGSISLVADKGENEGTFLPWRYSIDEASVIPLALMITRWASILAIRVKNNDQDYRVRMPWYKKNDPPNSSIFMLDTAKSNYYFPLSSTLSGEVVAGHPRSALIAFQPFRQATCSLQIHVSDVKLSSGRGNRHTFHFDYLSEGLSTKIADTMERPSLVDELGDVLGKEAERLRKEITTSGCPIPILFAFGCSGTGAALSILKLIAST